MKICQFFIPMLFITLSGGSLVALETVLTKRPDALKGLFADPDAFVASLSDASPEQISPIIELIEELIEDVQNKGKEAEAAYNVKKKAFDDVNDAYENKIDDEALLLGTIDTQEKEITSLKLEIEEAKLKIEIASEMTNTSTNNVHNLETEWPLLDSRVSEEKEILIKMRDILMSELPLAPTNSATKPPTTNSPTPPPTTRSPTNPPTTRSPTNPPTTRSPTPSPIALAPQQHYTHKVRACVAGHNIDKRTDMSVTECKQWCDQYGDDCKAFEYGVAYGGEGAYEPGDCQLQSSSDDSNCNGEDENLDLYVKDQEAPCDLEDNVDYAGNDIAKGFRDSQEECSAWCFSESDCVYWTYRPAIQKCWLKNSNSGWKEQPDYISGSKACGESAEVPTESSTDTPTGDMQKLQEWSVGEASSCTSIGCETLTGGETQCLEQCKTNVDCNLVNFCPVDADCTNLNQCCMRKCEDDDYQLVTNWKGWNIWTKTECSGEYIYDRGFAGNDLNNGNEVQTDSPEQCQDLCQSSPTCNAWEWGHNGQNCWLKSKLANQEIRTGRVAGERNSCPAGDLIEQGEVNSIPFISSNKLLSLSSGLNNEQKMGDYPEVIDEILELVNHALDGGIDETVEFNTSLASAQKYLEAREDLLSHANSEHESLTGDLVLKEDSLAKLKKEEDSLLLLKASALDAKNAAARELTIAQNDLNRVKDEVNSELDTLIKVDLLLKDIVASTPTPAA